MGLARAVFPPAEGWSIDAIANQSRRRRPCRFDGRRCAGMGGFEFLDRALRDDPGAHILVMTADYTLESAIEAIRRGATDFLPKPIDQSRLKRTLDEVAALYDQRRRVRRSRRARSSIVVRPAAGNRRHRSRP